MPTYQATAVSTAAAEAVWAAWTDVAGWSAHDHMESASIDGEFRTGATITTKARGFPKSELTLTRVEPPTVFVDESHAPGMRMTFEHLIEPGAQGTSLTERVVISGPLGRVVGPLLRRRLEELFAASVRSVVARADAASVTPPPGPA